MEEDIEEGEVTREKQVGSAGTDGVLNEEPPLVLVAYESTDALGALEQPAPSRVRARKEAKMRVFIGACLE